VLIDAVNFLAEWDSALANYVRLAAGGLSYANCLARLADSKPIHLEFQACWRAAQHQRRRRHVPSPILQDPNQEVPLERSWSAQGRAVAGRRALGVQLGDRADRTAGLQP